MRKEIYNDKYGIAFGQDHAMGRFVQVWKLNPKFHYSHFRNMPDSKNIIVDRDELSGELPIREVVSIAEKYGFDLSK